MRARVQCGGGHPGRGAIRAFTLVEVAVAVAIAGLGIGGIVWGYILAAQRTEWAAASSAAELMALRHLELTRAARWDPRIVPPVDDLLESNFPVRIEPLAVPQASGPALLGTNRTTIRDISANPPLRLVRVDCVWSLLNRGPFTNTVVTYRGAD